jgi:hypothetical protein
MILGHVGRASGQEPQSYPILCAGGGDTQLAFALFVDGNDDLAFSWRFNKASGGATRGLRPGECAWTDRPVSAEEPDVLRFHVQARTLNVDEFLEDGRTSSVIFRIGGNAQAADIVNKIRGGGNFQVYAYNNRSGALVVTRLGP